MAYANVTYTYTGSLAFAVPFEFLKNTHLYAKVDIDGVGVFVVDAGFTIAGDGNSVTFADSVTGGAAWISSTTLVNIYRTTPIADADRIVDFQSGSVLTEADLDNSALQTLYATQESADVAAKSMQLAPDDLNWDADSKGIINLSEPDLLTDAATKNYVDTVPLNRVTPGGVDAWDAETEKIINVIDPTTDQDAATKKYVDDTTSVAGNLPNVSGGAYDNNFVAVQGSTWTAETPIEARSTLGLVLGSGTGAIPVNSGTSGVTEIGTAAGVDTGTGSTNVPLNSSLTSAGIALALPICQFQWPLQSNLTVNANINNTACRTEIDDSSSPPLFLNNGESYFSKGTSDTTTIRSIVVASGIYLLHTAFRVRNSASSDGSLKANINNEAGTTVHLTIDGGTTVPDNTHGSYVTDTCFHVFNFSGSSQISLFICNSDIANGDLELTGMEAGQIGAVLIRLGDNV